MRLSMRSRLLLACSVPLFLLMIGAVSYKVIEGDSWSWHDAFYMSAITLTTVGYGETHPLTEAGRMFTIVFLFAGVFTLFFTATEIIRAVVSGQIQEIMGKEQMERALANVKNHVILCGLGRMGKHICHDLDKQKIPFVIIDRNTDLIGAANYEYGIPLQGDATQDETLIHAGIQRAKSLVTALPSDADNLYVVLTARILNEKAQIVARAEEESSVAKLRRVGANHVISVYAMGGRRAAQAILKPTVGTFLEMAGSHDADYIVEELLIEAGSELAGKTLRESHIHEEHGVVVLNIKCTNGDEILNPQRDIVLQAGQTLIAVGHRRQLHRVEKLARKPEAQG